MRIGGYDKLSTVDYPGELACAIFLVGCNFNCGYCHNPSLISGNGAYVPKEEVMEYLEFRKDMLDAVCISGGEPLLQVNLPNLLCDIKEMGFYIKLDTNGSFPDRLKAVVSEGLVDYVAMDLKNCANRYSETIGIPPLYQEKIEESIDFLLSGIVPYEFRTTVVKELHAIEDLLTAAKRIEGAERYYLQGFVNSEQVLKQGLSAYRADEMEWIRQKLLPFVPNTQLRGVK